MILPLVPVGITEAVTPTSLHAESPLYVIMDVPKMIDSPQAILKPPMAQNKGDIEPDGAAASRLIQVAPPTH